MNLDPTDKTSSEAASFNLMGSKVLLGLSMESSSEDKSVQSNYLMKLQAQILAEDVEHQKAEIKKKMAEQFKLQM